MTTGLILVVDDDPDLRLLLKMTLKKKGYEVLVAGGGDEALASARARKPDVVLLDVMMPGKDGFTTAAEFAETMGDECPKIVLMSGRDDARSEEALERPGVTALLKKPYAIPDLFAVLERTLGVLQKGESNEA